MMWTHVPWWHGAGMVAFWLLVVLLAIWATTRLFPDERPPAASGRALLDQRFARGEIDVEEYRRRREELLVADGQERPGERDGDGRRRR